MLREVQSKIYMKLENNSAEFILKTDFQKLINNRIEVLRLKLLDFTRRNPLISTKFSDRSNSFLRIVDSVPELLLQSLLNNGVSLTNSRKAKSTSVNL